MLLLPEVVGLLDHLNGAADVGDGLALGDQLLSGLEPGDFFSGVSWIRFVLESPAQAGRMRSLIHHGLISGGHACF